MSLVLKSKGKINAGKTELGFWDFLGRKNGMDAIFHTIPINIKSQQNNQYISDSIQCNDNCNDRGLVVVVSCIALDSDNGEWSLRRIKATTCNVTTMTRVCSEGWRSIYHGPLGCGSQS